MMGDDKNDGTEARRFESSIEAEAGEDIAALCAELRREAGEAEARNDLRDTVLAARGPRALTQVRTNAPDSGSESIPALG